MTLELWQDYMQASLGIYKPHADLLILDGLPRTLNQAKLIEPYIEVLGIVHLNAANKEDMVARLRKRAIEQKRVDDAKEDVIRNRLDIYERETRPVLNYYDQSLVPRDRRHRHPRRCAEQYAAGRCADPGCVPSQAL